MDHFRNFDHSSFNGVARSGGDASVDRRKRNYKLVLDPTLKPGSQKVYRFDGSLPGETTPLIVRDPRSRMKRFWTRREPAHLPVPKFKYDEYYVGMILPKEVTFCHLNDNINQSFLLDMCKSFGNVEECSIYYHPKTKKHLGLGRVLFTSTRAARQCCEKLHNTSKMGKVMTVIVDSMGAERDRMYCDMIADKPNPRPMSPKTPQAKDPRHKLPEHPPTLEIPVSVDRPVTAADRSASTDHSGFWTPGSGSAASSDRGYGTSSLPYPESVGGYSTTPSDAGFAAGQSDMSYPPSTPHTPQVGFIDNNMMQMAPPVTGYDSGMSGEGIMFNADSFQHPPPPYDAQGYEAPPHNFDRPYKQQQQRSGYGQYDQSFQKKDRGRDRRESRWEWNEHRDRQRRERHRGGKDRGRFHSYHKGREGEREHRERDRHHSGEWNRDRNKDWNNGRNWENGREWEEGRQWDSGGGRPREWESECNSHDNSWNKDLAEQQQYPPPPLPQPPLPQPPLQLQQPPAPLPPSVPLMPPTHIPPVPPPQSAPLVPPMPDITTAPPPLPHPVMAPPPARLSPEIDSRRSTSLEARIQSLLRQNSDFDDAGGDTDQPAPPDDDAPPLPPMTEDIEPPPLPPEPEECAPPLPEESAPPLPADGDGEAVCDIPSNGILSSGEMLSTFHTWATSDFVQEESVEVGADRTPVPTADAVNVTEVTSADIADAVQKTNIVDDDDDDHMSLSSLSSGEEILEVTVPPPLGVMQQQHPLPGGALFASPTLLPTWALDTKLQMQNMYNVSMMTHMQGSSILNSPSVNHEYEEEQMFSGVLEKVIAELRVIMMKDLSKKMVETSAFKSFEGWWDSEKNRQKKIIPNTTDKLSVAKATTAPTTKISDLNSISALFDNQPKGPGRAFGGGGILGLRGAASKLPSFRRKFRPPSPPPPDETFRGPRTPEGSDNDDVSDVESLPAKGKTKKTLIEDTDKSDSDSDDEEEDDEEEDSSSGASEEEESEEASSADEEDEDEDVEMQTDKEDSDAEQEISKPGTSHNVQEQDKPTLENGDVTKTTEDMTCEDSQSRLSPIIEVEEQKTRKRALPDEKTPTETGVSKTSVDIKEDIETPSIDAKDTSRDDVMKNGDRPVVPPAGDAIADLEKDSIEQLAEVDVCDDRTSGVLSVDSGLEKDVAMALLQMHDDQLADTDPAVTPPKPEETSHYTMTAEHNYFAPPKSTADKQVAAPGGKHEHTEADLTDSASEGEPNLIPCLPPTIQADHNYCRPFYPIEESVIPCKKRARKRTASTSSNILSLSDIDSPVVKFTDSDIPEPLEFVEVEETKKPKKKTSKAKGHGRKLADVTNLSRGSRELASLLPTIIEKPNFTPRPMQQEMAITYEFLFKGIDQEDVAYLQQRYEELLQDDSMQTYWLHDTHWVGHTHTLILNPAPPKKKRRHAADVVTTVHKTGAARTEGYYKISHHEKSGYLRHARGVQESQNADSDGPRLVFDPEVVKKKAEKSREARSESRRWQNVLSSMGEDCGDLLKFNQLKFRKKSLHFCRSGIHDWGLFALEPIAADEMVVEYVGQVIRQTVADQRERRYEAMGLGSSYLFRIDHDTIIDATKDGNMARFINHSCNPNCYAKIINVDALKKIVIYSRREIKVNEEVTYDYKFPIEDKKIPCFCGAPGCRGSLN